MKPKLTAFTAMVRPKDPLKPQLSYTMAERKLPIVYPLLSATSTTDTLQGVTMITHRLRPRASSHRAVRDCWLEVSAT